MRSRQKKSTKQHNKKQLSTEHRILQNTLLSIEIALPPLQTTQYEWAHLSSQTYSCSTGVNTDNKNNFLKELTFVHSKTWFNYALTFDFQKLYWIPEWGIVNLNSICIWGSYAGSIKFDTRIHSLIQTLLAQPMIHEHLLVILITSQRALIRTVNMAY